MARKNLDKLSMEFRIDAAVYSAMKKYPKEILSEEQEKKLQEAARSTIEEISMTLKNKKERKKGVNAIAHLQTERITKIKRSLDMKTYSVTVSNDSKKVEFKRKNKEFYEPILLKTSENFKDASFLQITSIVVEAFILVLNLVGIEVPDDEDTLRKIIDAVKTALGQFNTLLEDVNNIMNSNDLAEIAYNILMLVIDAYDTDIFWDIIEAIMSEMSWFDYVLSFVKVAAFVASLVFTGGIAEIADLILQISSAISFIEKLANLENIYALQKEALKG